MTRAWQPTQSFGGFEASIFTTKGIVTTLTNLVEDVGEGAAPAGVSLAAPSRVSLAAAAGVSFAAPPALA